VTPELDAALRIGAAALGGAAVGVERQWSGHATGPRQHFAGVRTFTLLGGLGGTAGWLWTGGVALLAAVVVAGAAALVVVAYAAASRRDVDGTTEVAALVVLAAGCASGLGHLALASGAVAVTALLLVEKSSLHQAVQRLDDVELRSAARFGVMAVVILPLLPPGPFGPLGGVRPQALWALVLLFSGLGFAGYAARRAGGARVGTALAGLLGGLVSSTAVTLGFARASRETPALAAALAAGVSTASATMCVRTLVVTSVIAPDLAVAALPVLGVPTLVAAALALARALATRADAAPPPAGPANPLQVGHAVGMALVFQAVLFALHAVRAWLGEPGLLASGALIGLADVDALILGMGRSVAAHDTPAATAALALALGVLSNTALKAGIALALGGRGFRAPAAIDLGVLAAAVTLGVLLAR